MKLVLMLLGLAVVLQAQTFPSPRNTPPSAIFRAEPEYTQEALDAKLAGTVTLQTMIGEDGVPAAITVTRSLGKGLDEKAVECLQKWRFKPATRDGQPVAVRATVEINFRLPG
jgi:periplasmic protein TonB